MTELKLKCNICKFHLGCLSKKAKFAYIYIYVSIPNLSIRTLIAPSTKKPPRFHAQCSLVWSSVTQLTVLQYLSSNGMTGVGSRDAYASKDWLYYTFSSNTCVNLPLQIPLCRKSHSHSSGYSLSVSESVGGWRC